MISTAHKRVNRWRLVLTLVATLLLASQWLEAGHTHDAGLATPDCLQCQLDTGPALLTATAASIIICLYCAPLVRHQAPVTRRTHASYIARGPPVYPV